MARAEQMSRTIGSGVRLALVASGLLALGACDQIQALIGGPGPEVVEPAQAKLREGDLPGAAAEYANLASQHPTSVHVGVGRAYMQLLAGDAAGADATLAAIEEGAGEQLGEIKLRRALVALQAGNLDSVKIHGKASGLPEGKLLAAEVHLVDLEGADAADLLREVAGAGGVVGETASVYLAMVDSGNQIKTGLAEASALWALGDRETACKSAEELVKALPDEDADKSEQLLLWAGRAATSNKPQVASRLLEEIAFPPDGQVWRVQATKALVLFAKGEVGQGMKLLDALEQGGAPADGLADVRATACGLVKDKDQAKQIVGELESSAVARCLLEAGAGQVAKARAPEGPLKTYLENK